MEHFAKDDPRFLAGTGLIYYELDSISNTIDRTYGTVDQKVHYPKFTDLVGMGAWSLPKPNFVLEEMTAGELVDKIKQDSSTRTMTPPPAHNTGKHRPHIDPGPNQHKKTNENFTIGYNDAYVYDMFYE